MARMRESDATRRRELMIVPSLSALAMDGEIRWAWCDLNAARRRSHLQLVALYASGALFFARSLEIPRHDFQETDLTQGCPSSAPPIECNQRSRPDGFEQKILYFN